jgi:hypothetical protein
MVVGQHFERAQDRCIGRGDGAVGLLTLLSLMSSVRGEATGLWIAWLGQLAGKGAFVLPIALILVGLWLIFRNLEHLPLLSLERIVGLVLLYLNILTFLHMVTRGSYRYRSRGPGRRLYRRLFRLAADAWALASPAPMWLWRPGS